MSTPRRKGVSPVFPLHITQKIPSDNLLSITIESSILLQNIIKSEIINRIDSATIANLGWQITEDLPPQTDVESALRICIDRFRKSEEYQEVVKLASEIGESALEECSMKRIMNIVFEDPDKENLRDRIVKLFTFFIEVCIYLLRMDAKPDRFQHFFASCMHFSNDVLAEKICEHGDWLSVMLRNRSKSLLEFANSEKYVKAIRDNPGVFSLCMCCLFVGSVIIISLKKHS